MRVTLDHNYAMAEFLGASGLTDTDLSELTPRLTSIDHDLAAARQSGQARFIELPYQTQIVKEIREAAKPLLEWCWDAVVLGLGGSGLGARALHQALRPPQHNKVPMARRNHKLGLWVADNIDPDHFWGLLDGLDMRRTGFNVISISNHQPETLAQFLWVYRLLKNRIGEDKARERIIITAEPDEGPFKRLIAREHLPSLPVPPQVGSHFSVLSAAGLLPAFLAGIDIEELLAGARAMDQDLKEASVDRNPAYRLTALFYLFATAKKRPILVFMPYANALSGLAEWFGQLWTASLGKQTTGSTPVTALGATDQQSQLQFYMEGPTDKLITFLTVDKFTNDIEIADSYPDDPAFSNLDGRSFQELLGKGQQAAAFNLMKAGRPNLTLHLPEINPFTIGQLIYLLEVVTAAAVGLFGVKAYDQPGAEGGKRGASGYIGRARFESFSQEMATAPQGLDKYRIT
jgi:glucose-6-phosphate isomerase